MRAEDGAAGDAGENLDVAQNVEFGEAGEHADVVERGAKTPARKPQPELAAEGAAHGLVVAAQKLPERGGGLRSLELLLRDHPL